MTKRINVKEHEPIDVAFTRRERALIIDHTFVDPELTGALESAREKHGKLLAALTVYDLEELCGYIAAEANHTKDLRLERELRKLFGRLSDVMERYDDGNWQSNLRGGAEQSASTRPRPRGRSAKRETARRGRGA